MSETVTHIDLYWRPGCPFCSALERRLDGSPLPIERHNIWDDESAAAAVRAHADGNETVPTVVIGDVGLVNPSVGDINAAVRANAPQLAELLGPEEPPGRLRRFLGGT